MAYTNEQWSKLLDRIFGKVQALAQSKGAEYSGNTDRLDNFRRNGERLGLRMEVVWGVYAGKHWDALQTYIRDVNIGQTRKYSESIEGWAEDLIVYLLLFLAMCEERGGALRPLTTWSEASTNSFWRCPHCQEDFPANKLHLCPKAPIRVR